MLCRLCKCHHTSHRVLPPVTVGAGDDPPGEGPEAAPALLAALRLIYPVSPLAVCSGDRLVRYYGHCNLLPTFQFGHHYAGVPVLLLS